MTPKLIQWILRNIYYIPCYPMSMFSILQRSSERLLPQLETQSFLWPALLHSRKDSKILCLTSLLASMCFYSVLNPGKTDSLFLVIEIAANFFSVIHFTQQVLTEHLLYTIQSSRSAYLSKQDKHGCSWEVKGQFPGPRW